VAPLTSIAAAVAGEQADVHGIVPEGVNSHTWEPPPGVARELAAADVVVLNGLGLEEPARRLAEQVRGPRTELVELGPATLDESRWLYDDAFPRAAGRPNPHLWTDPRLARRYGELVRDTLSRRDPAGAEAYRRNADALLAAVDRLDAAVRTAVATIPPRQRKLVTYHDAYAYVGADYGLEVVGALQMADMAEPTAREVAGLVEQVRAAGVPAIFGSEVFPSPVLEQIGRETGVRYVDVLRDDDLPGAPGEPGHSLVGLLRFDFATITGALGGDPAALQALDVEVPVPDRAAYPQ
jgi:ABC-type Zn uptake system ZnuABC Zn-binding protein ZnuA